MNLDVLHAGFPFGLSWVNGVRTAEMPFVQLKLAGGSPSLMVARGVNPSVMIAKREASKLDRHKAGKGTAGNRVIVRE